MYVLQSIKGKHEFVNRAFDRFDDCANHSLHYPDSLFCIYETSNDIPVFMCRVKNAKLYFPQTYTLRPTRFVDFAPGDIVSNGYGRGIVLANSVILGCGYITVCWRNPTPREITVEYESYRFGDWGKVVAKNSVKMNVKRSLSVKKISLTNYAQ